MITIIKESFSLSLNRKTKIGESLEFTKPIENEYIFKGYAIDKPIKKTKERKQTIKKK